jgi:hypothetical protein
MTVIPKEQFKGTTRKGIEDIRNALADVEKSTSSAIQVALEEHGETVVEFFHRSERAAEIDWVNFKKYREQSRRSVIEAPFIVVGLMALVGVISTLFVTYADILGIPEADAPPPSFILGCAALALAYPFVSGLKELIREARLGYTTYFKAAMRYRLNSAWAISNEAVYTARISRSDDEFIEVTRIPFYEIQACAYANYEGLQTTHLYAKNGDNFVISEPVGTSLSGAANLANHIWSMTVKSPRIEGHE